MFFRIFFIVQIMEQSYKPPKLLFIPIAQGFCKIPHAAFDGQGMLPMKRFLIVFLDEVPCLLSCICHRLCSFLEVWLPHNSTYQYSTERPFYSQKMPYWIIVSFCPMFIILRSIRIQSYVTSWPWTTTLQSSSFCVQSESNPTAPQSFNSSFLNFHSQH